MRILLADDERSIAVTLSDDLRRAGHSVQVVPDGPQALSALGGSPPFDVLITDLRMPGLGGMELLAEIDRRGLPTQAIVMTGYATIESAIRATRAGAVEYLLKPFDNEDMLRAVALLAPAGPGRSALPPAPAGAGRDPLEDLVGASPPMLQLRQRMRAVAESEARILMTGESGTGKERVARVIHKLSRRRAGPFVALACAAIPEPLLEAEIFGHERGAFTDAKERRAGRFERAHGGTLLLDDIDDMPLATQVKLLRVLQEGEVEPLGATQTVHVDVRVIAATKVDLGAQVERGRFREDLFYRLSVVPVDLPPLRDRPGDVALLVQHFLRRVGGERTWVLPADGLQRLAAHDWPGNVRELENAVERAVALGGPDGVLSVDAMLETPLRRMHGSPRLARASVPMIPLHQVVAEAERTHIQGVLDAVDGRRLEAARVLGISRKHLWKKAGEYGIV